MVKPDRATLEYYSGAVERFSNQPHDRGFVSEPMNRFVSALPPGAEVLELGCGAGQDAAAMAKLGLNVEATDGCPEIAKIAEQRLGRKVRVMRFDELDVKERYHGIWANATLLHVLRTDLVEVLRRVHTAIKPGGMLFASFKTGRPEGRDKFGRYFNYPSEEELVSFLNEAGGWSKIEMMKYSGVGYDQLLTDWLLCFAHKAATPSTG
jgi:SAM-dependent methyltransferase